MASRICPANAVASATVIPFLYTSMPTLAPTPWSANGGAEPGRLSNRLVAGRELAVDAREMSGDILGYLPPMVLPWGYIGIGVATVLFAALIASWWPAKSVANAEPLLLLQSGRAAA